MSLTFPRRIIQEAAGSAAILDVHQSGSWDPGFAVEAYGDADAYIFLAALGVCTERSSLASDKAYQLAMYAKIRPYEQRFVVYFPGWELKD